MIEEFVISLRDILQLILVREHKRGVVLAFNNEV
jgi:hypothetical protein